MNEPIACYCCPNTAQFVWRKGVAVELCGRCFFEAVRCWNDFKVTPSPYNGVSYEELLNALIAYVTLGNYHQASQHLGVSDRTIRNRIDTLERLKGEVVERDYLGRCTSVLSAAGAEIVALWKNEQATIHNGG